MRRCFVITLTCAAFFPLIGIEEPPTPARINKRVNSHVVIGDYTAACDEAAAGLQRYPHSKLVWEAYLRALATAGDEKNMMSQWKVFVGIFPEEKDNREMLECMAWAVINKGFCSSTPIIRIIAMLGAFFSQDAKGVAILREGLKDNNSLMRAAAVKLSSHLFDATLQEEMLKMLRTEKVWKVRLEVIHAMGKLRVVDAKKDLKKIIADNSCHAEEKAVAIEALVSLSENIDPQQLSQLVASDRAGMRMLACEFVSHFEQLQDVDSLYPLLSDHHSAVRAQLLRMLGRLRVTSIAGQSVTAFAAQAATDSDPVVAVTAAWVLTINNPDWGMPIFQNLLNHQVRETRYLAAAALAATGKYGLPLTVKIFREHTDPYVRMNLALGMIGQRVDVQPACDCLYAGLMQQKERWDWGEENNFKVLAPSKAKHDEAIPNYPEAVNQLARLEILQVLSVVHYPKAQQAIKEFLQESNWGISGMASALLLTEGDDEAVALVQALLQDNNPKVKVQAALILALWGKGDDVVKLLQDAYLTADRELKGQILEGVGRVGSENSLYFLAERLQEPYQTLRIIAAAALLECLYH
ncbi:MAG: HEAT repeat domain-containing protein [Parachlamydiaceae bacterium]